MKKKQKLSALIIGVLLAAGSTCSFAASEVVRDTLDSKILGKNINFQVYLPDGYKDASEPYPVIYLLHGAGGDESTWLTKGGIQVTADALMERKELRSSVIVMPTEGPASWYTDGNSDKAETAFVDDIIPYIEGKYKVKKDRPNRSIAGLSMGGYGALNLSLSHPQLFCAAAVLSPAIYDPFPPETSASRKTPQFTKDGKFDEQAWTNSLYPARLAAYKEAKTIVPMWIESGDHDKFGIVLAAAKLYWTLHAYQPADIEYRVINGDHDWLVFRESAVHALPYISRKCADSK